MAALKLNEIYSKIDKKWVSTQLEHGRVCVIQVDGTFDTYVEFKSTKNKTEAYYVQFDLTEYSFCVRLLEGEIRKSYNQKKYFLAIISAVMYNSSFGNKRIVPISTPDIDTMVLTYANSKVKYSYFRLEEIKRLDQMGILKHVTDTMETQILKIHTMNEEKKREVTLYTESLVDFYARCKNGDFIIPYEWNDIQKKYIVPLDYLDTFVPTESFRLLLLSVHTQVMDIIKRMEKGMEGTAAIGKLPVNIKVMGKPGSGKTSAIEAVLASLGYPKGLVNCKDRMEEDEIEGQSKFIQGSVRNIPSKVGELHGIGGAIVLEEFNLPDAGILQGTLGQALVYPYVLKMDGYRESVRHPLTLYFATMNVGTCGSKALNEALSSRFPEGHILEDVKEEEFIEILESVGYEKAMCEKVYRDYQIILHYLRENAEELVLAVTLRHCINALDKMDIGFSRKIAYTNTFLSQLYSSDPDVAKEVAALLKIQM